jgi:putative glutamine amidotransferase
MKDESGNKLALQISSFIRHPSSFDSRPVIGVTGPDAGGGAAWWFTRFAVWLAGGHAVRITPKHPRRIDGLDGLIVGGGADVDPQLYGQEESVIVPTHRPPGEPRLLYALEWVVSPLIWLARKLSGMLASHGGGDAGRDELEMRLLNEAVAAGLPVLGICRGEQLLNVCFGGSLHRDLAGFYVEDPEVRTILPRKQIALEPGTTLRRLLREPVARVNALHRHAIDRLGNGLRVAARDRNGIVQAIEHERLPFVVGVQWHPEYLPQLREQRRIFKALVKEAKGHSAPATNVEPAPQATHHAGASFAPPRMRVPTR